MKTKKHIGKKVLSVFLAVLMIMTAWVFVPGNHQIEAEAATSGYTITANFTVSDACNGGTVKCDITFADGSTTTWNLDKCESDEGTYDITSSQYSKWPKKLVFTVDQGGMRSQNVKLNNFRINGKTIIAGGWTMNPGWWSKNTKTFESNGSQSSGGDTGSPSTNWWPTPAVTSVDVAPSAGTINVPKSGSATGSFTAKYKDQYDVAIDGSGATATFDPVTGATISMSGNTATVTADKSVFDNLSGYSTSTGKATSTLKITNNGVTTSCTVTFQAPKFNLKFQNLDGTSLSSVDYYYKTSVDCASIASGLKNSVKKIDGDEDYHQNYKWDTTKYVTSITADTVITEVASDKAAHTYGDYTQGTDNHSRTCSVCGYVDTDAHVPQETGTVDKEANCTDTGSKSYDCTVCGKTDVKVESIPAKGHNFTGELVNNGDGTHSRKCVNAGCDETGIGTVAGASEGHVFKNLGYHDDEHHRSTCDCGATNDEAHIWLTIEEKEATCKDKGYIKKQCLDCNSTKTEEIEATGVHVFEYYESNGDATCYADGTKTAYCEYGCGAEDKVTDVGSMQNHIDTRECDSVVTPPTCEEGGYTTFTCKGCGYEFKGDETAPTGHDWELVDSKAETCTVDGYKTYICKNCDLPKTDIIEAPGHKEESIPAVAATCDETGLTEGKKCKVCGEITVAQTVVPQLGHNYESAVTKKATCTENGEITYTCKNNASHVYTEVIPLLGHTDKNPEDNVCDRCNEKLCDHEGYDRVLEGYYDATCTEPGFSGNLICQGCKSAITIGQIIPAKGHTEGPAATCTTNQICTVCNVVLVKAFGHTEAEAVTEKYVAANCTTDGSYDTVVYCATCKIELTRTPVTIDKIGHAFEETVAAKDTSCLAPGNKAYKKCSNCNLYFADTAGAYTEGGKADNSSFIIAQLDHSYTGEIRNNNDDTHSRRCVNGCGEFSVGVAHTWDKGNVTLKETCTSEGSVTYTCTEGCGAKRTETIPAINHKNYVYFEALGANKCDEVGHAAFYRCKDCKIVSLKADFSEIVDPKDDGVGADGTVDNRIANNGVPDVLDFVGDGHVWHEDGKDDVYVSMSDGEGGTHKIKCTKCSALGEETAHTYKENEDKATTSTCSVAGKKVYECTACDSSYEVALEKAPHELEEVEKVEPSCKDYGYNAHYKCKACDARFKDAEGKTATTLDAEKINKLGHVWTQNRHNENDTPIKAATCQSVAVYQTLCDNCDQKIYGLTHEYGEPDTVNGHQFNGEIKAEENGKHSFKCTVEGCDAYGAAVDCAYEVTEDVASTCISVGHTTSVCTVCGNSKTVDKDGKDSENHDGGVEVRFAFDAMCNKDGYTGDTYCLGCKAEIAKGETIKADKTVHPHMAMTDYEGQAATCQEAGYKAYRYCADCGTYEIAKEEIPAKAHVFTTYTANNDGTHTATCDTCADGTEKATDVQDCSGGVANCKDKKVCTVCNATYGEVDATNHKSVTTIPQVDPTCQKTGKTAYKYCEACDTNVTESEEIGTIAHSFSDEWKRVEGTETHTRSCTTCKASDGDIATQTEECSGGVANCKDKAVCATCGVAYGEIDADNHSSNKTVTKNAKEATCTEAGYTGDKYYECCPEVLKEAGTEIKMLDHDMQEVSRVPATCTETGSVTYKCSTCPAETAVTTTETLGKNPKNHSSEETNIVGKKDATCTEDGYTGDVIYACCEAVKEKGTAIKSNGEHTYTELIPEYKIAEIVVTTDENGKTVKEIKLVEGEITYEAMIAKRHEDGKWYHVKMCTACYEVETGACYTYENNADCVSYDTCEECAGLCSLIAKNNHGALNTIKKVPATCVAEGTKTYYQCTACGKEYFDASCRNEITDANRETLNIPSTGSHTIDRSQTPVAILDEEGNSTGKHTYKCSFTYTDADGETKICGVEITEDCTGGEAFCNSKAVCEYCGTGYGEKDADNHAEKPVILDDVAADKCKPGYSGKTVYPCCDVVASEGKEIPALTDHTWTETTEGQVDNCAQGYTVIKTCEVCGETETEEVAGRNHNYVVVYETEKDCTIERKIYRACSICSYAPESVVIDGVTYNYITVETVAASDSCEWTPWVYEVSATCVNEGKKTRSCTECGKVDVEILPLAAHITNIEYGYAATCKSEGLQNYVYCVVEGCPYGKGGAILDANQAGEYIPAYEHGEDKNNDDYCDHCKEYIGTNSDGTNCNCVCHKQNGFMKFIYSILRFFWKLFGINKSCCSAGVHY